VRVRRPQARACFAAPRAARVPMPARAAVPSGTANIPRRARHGERHSLPVKRLREAVTMFYTRCQARCCQTREEMFDLLKRVRDPAACASAETINAREIEAAPPAATREKSARCAARQWHERDYAAP